MSKEATKKFVENNGFICNKCGKVIVDGHKHKNEEDLCDQCKISDLEAKLAESEKEIKYYANRNVELLDESLNLIRANNQYFEENTKFKQQLAEKDKEIIKDKIHLLEFLKANFADVYLNGVMKIDCYDRVKYSKDVDSIIDREISKLKGEW